MRLLFLVGLACVTACSTVEPKDPARSPTDADRDGIDADLDCDDGNVDVGAAGTVYTDSDGDGFGAPSTEREGCAGDGLASNGMDCDDSRASVFPGAQETCNAVDDDCDGATDDDATDTVTVYADADGDGFGDPAQGAVACGPAEGQVAEGTDCDDADPGVRPDADETCNGVDDDCDGETDEPDATDALPWYADLDDDGHGAGAPLLACDAPEGHAATDDDCDDGDATVRPGAAERCNGVDDDCDAGTGEAGLATFTDAAGTRTDVTGLMTGTPARVTLADPGTLTFCEGTWRVNLDIAADVVLESQTGDASTTVLDGAGTGSVVQVTTDGVEVTLANVTVQRGAGSYNPRFGVDGGGGVYCGAESTLTVEGVHFLENTAAYGGGLWSSPCTTTIDDTRFEGNAAEWGGALFAYLSPLRLTGSSIRGNDADYGGGMFLGDSVFAVSDTAVSGNTARTAGGLLVYGSDGATELVAENLAVTDNDATQGGGVATIGDPGVTWTDDGTGASAITGNHDDGAGGLYVGDARFELRGVNLGTLTAGTDNSPHDVGASRGGRYMAGESATFSCSAGRCGTSVRTSLSATSGTQSAGSYTLGQVFVATTTGTIDSFAPYTYVTDDACTMNAYVASAASESDTDWTVEWAGTGISSTTSWGMQSMGDVHLPVVAGRAYALLWEASSTSCDIGYAYDSTTGATVTGLGTSSAYVFRFAPSSAAAVGDTLTLSRQTDTDWRMDVYATEL